MSYILVDLDGTLAFYPPSRGQEIGTPVAKMVARVKKWLDEGKEVRIFTARVGYHGGEELSVAAAIMEEAIRQRELVEAWCEKHIGQVLPVVCWKDYGCVEIWDDCVIQVARNTGCRIDGCSE